jgi:uncharacterized protein YhaN
MAEARRRLADLQDEARQTRLDPVEHERLRREVETARDRQQAAADDLALARRALALREAAEKRREFDRRIADLALKLDTCPDGPPLLDDAAARVTGAATREALARSVIEAEMARRDAAQTRLDARQPDTEGEEVARILSRLRAATFDKSEPLEDRAVTNAADIAGVEAQIAETDAAIRQRLRALPGRETADQPEDLETLILPGETVERLKQAVLKLEQAQDRQRQIEDSIAEQEATAGEAVEPPPGLDALADALDALTKDRRDPDALRATAETSEAEARHAASGLPAAWPSMVDAGLPTDEEIAARVKAMADAGHKRETAIAARSEAEAAHREASAAQTAAESSHEAMTAADLVALRSAREQSWAAHRAGMTDLTASAFETAMRADDLARERYLAHADARARIDAMREDLERKAAALTSRRAAVEQAQQAWQGEAAATATMAQALGLAPDAPATSFAARRAALLTAQSRHEQARQARQVADAALDARAALLDEVESAHRAAGGAEVPRASLVEAASRLRLSLQAQKTRADAYASAMKTIATLRPRAATAQAAVETASAALAEAMRGLWCADHDPPALAQMIPHLSVLATLRTKRDDLALRLERMREAISAFIAITAPACVILGLDRVLSPSELVGAMEARARKAETIRRAIEADAAVIADAAERIETAEADARKARLEIETVLAGQALDPSMPPTEALAVLQARDRLRDEKARLEEAHRAAGTGLDPDALASEERDADPARTPALADAVTHAEAELSRQSEALGAARAALSAAEARDGMARALQARATLVETLRDEARTHAALLLGLRAAKDALRRFREEHRGQMLDDAEAAFRHLTCGEWDKLQPEPDKRGNLVLKALRDGRAHAMEDLSTGTRAQLYLALRIAGFRQFVAENGPLPFVTDDIHETFDEDRVTAALDLAAELGAAGQMIIFTHHAHVMHIARDRIETARLLEIGGPDVSLPEDALPVSGS